MMKIKYSPGCQSRANFAMEQVFPIPGDAKIMKNYGYCFGDIFLK